MFNYTDNIKIVSSFKQAHKPYGKIINRFAHAFIFQIKGQTVYSFSDKQIVLNEGEFAFLPGGSMYEYTCPEKENLYSSINFQATVDNPRVSIYSIDSFYSAAYTAENFSELWNFGTVSDKYQCSALLYELLSHISKFENLNTKDKRKYNLIEPGIEYLKKHIYDNSLKVDKLHRLCGISDTYFRKIFVKRFGMTPKEYILTERIAHAKSILYSGDYESIREVSELVGYEDPLHFSKAFKKIYGFAPSSIND